MNVVEVTDRNFQDVVLNGEKSILVDFWAAGCGSCRGMMPLLEEIAGVHCSALSIAKINIEENPESAKEYRVLSLPTMILFQGGRPVKTLVGRRSKGQLLTELAEYVEM